MALRRQHRLSLAHRRGYRAALSCDAETEIYAADSSSPSAFSAVNNILSLQPNFRIVCKDREKAAIMNTKVEFPTEWTMPDEVEDRDGRVDEPDGGVSLAGGDPPGAASMVHPAGFNVEIPPRIAGNSQVSGG